MIIEHWIDDECDSLFPQDCSPEDRAQHMRLMVGTPRKCCEIQAETWDECMAKYHQHMGWKPYVPMAPLTNRSPL